MFPIDVIKKATGDLVFIELKDNTKYMGNLSAVDQWMNIVLENATKKNCNTNIKKIYIRGYSIKRVCIEKTVLQKKAQNEQETK